MIVAVFVKFIKFERLYKDQMKDYKKTNLISLYSKNDIVKMYGR